MWVDKTTHPVDIVQAVNVGSEDVLRIVAQVDVPAAITIDPATGKQTVYLSLDGSFQSNLIYKSDSVNNDHESSTSRPAA